MGADTNGFLCFGYQLQVGSGGDGGGSKQVVATRLATG